MLPALLLLAAVAATNTDTTHLVIVATADVHGHATEWDFVSDRAFGGGLARAARAIDSLRARYPGQVIVVDAGDLLEGEPFADYFARVAPRDPHPVIEAMNLIGYDVATPGDHDFDYGLATFGRAVRAATFRWVSGNIRDLPGDTLPFPAYLVLRRNGVRIGIAGFTTPGGIVWNATALRGKLRVARIGESAARVLPELRRESDLAVVLMHSGMDGGSSYDTTGVGGENVAATLAAEAAKPDLVVVGHSHREMIDSVIGGVHFVEPKPFAQSLAVVHVDLARRAPGEPWRVLRIRGESVPLAQVSPSPRLAPRQMKARADVSHWMGQSLGEARGAMPSALARAEPTPIMNLLLAAERKRSGAELASASAFDLKAGFGDGDILLRQVFALYPHENTLRAVRISGAALKAYLEQSAAYFVSDSFSRVALNDSIPGYNYDMVSGATYEIDLRLPVGSRIRNLSVRGRPVAPTDSFTLALNSYRQSGGGGFAMFKTAPVVYDRNENVRDLLVDEIKARRQLDPAEFADTNWRIVPAEAAANVRALFGAAPPPKVAGAASTEQVLLRVIALGGFHGTLAPRAFAAAPGRGAGGAAALKTVFDREAADCHCPTLRLAPGDMLQGSPESDLVAGRSAIEALNGLGLSATALGPRDFVWSLDTLRQRVAQSRFPWLAANLVDSATGRRPDWVVPYRILVAGTLRVAVIGYVAPAAQAYLRAAQIRGLKVEDGVGAVRGALAEAARERPDFTVVIAHADAVCRGANCTGDAVDLARALEGAPVDVIVSGDHGVGAMARVGKIAVLQARPGGAEIGVIDVLRTAVGDREIRTRLDWVDADAVRPDSGMAALVGRYRVLADSLSRTVIARIKLPIPRSEGGRSPLGDLFADAERNALRADLAIVSLPPAGADLPAGPLTYGRLLGLASAEPLVTLTLNGVVLRQLMEQLLVDGTPPAQLSGLTVRYDGRAPAGRRVKRLRLLDGREIKEGATYTLALTRTLQEDPSYQRLIPGPAVPSTLSDLDAMVAYLRRLPQPVEPPAEPRFEEVKR